MSDVYVLGLDPGFASFGYCVFRFTKEGEEVVAVNVIRTKKTAKKKNVLASDDNFRRARAIAAVLREVVEGFQPRAIAAEALSLPRNASAAAKVAMSWGILADIVEDRQIPLIQQSPQGLKKALCGKKSATKQDIQEVLEGLYPGAFDQFISATPKGQWEHGFDAASAVVGLKDSDVLRAVRSMIP